MADFYAARAGTNAGAPLDGFLTAVHIEDGRLNRRLVRFRHRTEDSRLEIVGGVPERARVVMRVAPGWQVGRTARISEGKGL